MAAILALVFVPALAATLLMFGIVGGGMSFTAAAAGTIFVALAAGMLIGLLRLARTWDSDQTT